MITHLTYEPRSCNSKVARSLGQRHSPDGKSVIFRRGLHLSNLFCRNDRLNPPNLDWDIRLSGDLKPFNSPPYIGNLNATKSKLALAHDEGGIFLIYWSDKAGLKRKMRSCDDAF